MEEKARADLGRTARVAALTIAVVLLLGAGSAMADIKYLGDGAKQNPTNNGWDLPLQGTCQQDLTKTTRPACLALRLGTLTTGAYQTKALCEALVSGVQVRSWSTGVCNDTLATDATTCNGKPDRYWDSTTNICAIVMYGDDRNSVECMVHNGTWVAAGTCTGNWIMPLRTDYTPNVLTSNGSNGTGAGAGDQCLRCHNTLTQYNSTRVRDTEDTLFMGHKNMARPVVPNQPWGGPPLHCVNGSNVEQPSYTAEEPCIQAGFKWVPKDQYPSDDAGNPINWTAGTINVGGSCSNPTYPTQTLCVAGGGTWTPGTDYSLAWIYGDWLASLPRAIYKAPATTLASQQVCTDPRGNATNCVSFYGGTMVNNAGASYSCGRCHTTGWTSDASVNTLKEPEATFSGITFPRTSNALANMVNLSGGVANDPKQTSSWDVWGISCTRCHGSAVDTTTGGGVPPFTAALGTSSHHSNLTAPDFPGACSVPGSSCSGGRCTQSNCAAGGGVWYYGYCTDPRFLGGAQSAAGAKTACETHTVGGVDLGVSAPGFPSGTWVTPCSDNSAATATDCALISGATWNLPVSTCSVAGLCNDPAMTTSGTCTGTVASGPLTGLVRQWQATTDIVSCVDAGGKWTGGLAQRGQIITALCMNCHRQETSGYPNTNGSCAGWVVALSASAPTTQGACVAAQGTWTDSGNGIGMTVGPYHSTVTFPSHPHGNQFLNSPHGKFTGTFSQIATGKFLFGSPAGKYLSFFLNDGEAGNTGNGCTGCHEVHTSTVAGERPFREECTECHAKNLNLINHPKGTGTPLEKMATEPFEACVSCHMPGGEHLFRINVNSGYSTFPMPAAMKANTSPNTAADGTFTNAVWVDLDAACGQCHGGGTSQATNTAGRVDLKFSDAGVAGAVSCASVGGTWASNKCTDTVNNNSALCANVGGTFSAGACTLTAGKYLQVGDTAGFLANEKIRIPDAGSLSYDGEPSPVLHKGDLDTYIFAIKVAGAPGILTLAGAPSYPVSGKKVVQNATTNGGSWFSKALLATYAKGMHNDAPTALFTVAYGENPSNIMVDASQSKCSGSLANCNVFDWNWGDASPNGSGVTATHAYALPGTYTVTLTVTQYGFAPGVTSRPVTAYAYDVPPTAAGSCSVDYTTWMASCSNTSTDDNGFQLAAINWGDGTVVSTITGLGSGPFTHKFLIPGNYKITLMVVDSNGQGPTAGPFLLGNALAVNFNYYTISGKVFKAGGVLPLGAAQIQVKNGANVLVKNVMSAADGSYTTGNMKPDTYKLTVSKSGYTFAVPTLTVTIPPSATGKNFTAN
jgi:hypothetical protein